MAKILYVVPDFNMCGQHLSTKIQLKHRGVDISTTKPGDIIVMINRKKSILRIVTMLPEKDSFGFLGGYKSPHGRVPMEAIRYIAECLGSNGFDMNQAIRKSLIKHLGGDA